MRVEIGATSAGRWNCARIPAWTCGNSRCGVEDKLRLLLLACQDTQKTSQGVACAGTCLSATVLQLGCPRAPNSGRSLHMQECGALLTLHKSMCSGVARQRVSAAGAAVVVATAIDIVFLTGSVSTKIHGNMLLHFEHLPTWIWFHAGRPTS